MAAERARVQLHHQIVIGAHTRQLQQHMGRETRRIA
jgi:hypothetical protein